MAGDAKASAKLGGLNAPPPPAPPQAADGRGRAAPQSAATATASPCRSGWQRDGNNRPADPRVAPTVGGAVLGIKATGSGQAEYCRHSRNAASAASLCGDKHVGAPSAQTCECCDREGSAPPPQSRKSRTR